MWILLKYNINKINSPSQRSSNIVSFQCNMHLILNFVSSLSKTGKASLGESLYKDITSEWFSPEIFLSSSDLSSEHKVIDLANRLEAAVYVWRRRNPSKPAQKAHQSTKQSWGKVKDFVSDGMRRDLLTDRVESALVCLKQRFPHLRQSCLDVTKIQYNKASIHPSSAMIFYTTCLFLLSF
jgi:hypothetical protein